MQDNLTSLFKLFDDYFIGIFHIDTLVFWNLFGEFASFVERDWWVVRVNKLFFNTKLVIVLTESWSAVNDT